MSNKFEAWGVVEIMGHQSLAGRLSEQVVAGANLLRVDVPQDINGEGAFRTEYIGANSIYRMRVTTEEVARPLRCAALLIRRMPLACVCRHRNSRMRPPTRCTARLWMTRIRTTKTSFNPV